MGVLLKLFPSFAPGITALLNPWVLLGFVIYTLAVATLAGLQGHKLGMNEYYQYIAKQAQETILFITKVEKVKEIVRVPHIQREVVIQTVYEKAQQEVQHVPVRAACNITAGWMRVHDSAAEGQDRRIVGSVDDPTDTGITEARALSEAILPNYRSYHQVANDLTACRAFVNGLKKITGETASP